MSNEASKLAEIRRALDRLGEPEKRALREAACRVDAVAFARIKLGVAPDEWQTRLMRGTSDVVALCGRRVGKSQSAGWAAAHHVVEGRNRTALCISPTQRQSGEVFRLAKAAIVKSLPDADFPTDNRLSVELPNGSRLLSLPGDPGTVRGLTASLVVLDETQSLPDGGHELFASVRPMLATTGGRMIVLGTPLDRVGLLFDVWEGDAAREWQKLHVPSTDCPRIPASFLESERRLLGEVIFRREYLAEFSASATGMFDPDLLQAAMLPDGFEFVTSRRSPIERTVATGASSPSLRGALARAILPV